MSVKTNILECHVTSHFFFQFKQDIFFAPENWNKKFLFKISSNCLVSKEMRHCIQSHYREVPLWGVSNVARHNWKCFLAYKKFEVFFQKFICFWYIKMCHIYQKHFWVIGWFHRSKDFEAMKAGKLANWPKSCPNLNSCSIKITHRGTSI